MKIELIKKNVELIRREERKEKLQQKLQQKLEEKLQQKLTSCPTFADPGIVERSPFQRACKVLVLQNSKEHHVEFIYDYNQSTNYFDNTTIMVSSTTYFTPHEYLSISCSCSSIFFTRENHLERTFFKSFLAIWIKTNPPVWTWHCQRPGSRGCVRCRTNPRFRRCSPSRRLGPSSCHRSCLGWRTGPWCPP